MKICQPMSGKASAKLLNCTNLNTNKTYRWNEWNIPTIQNSIAEGAPTHKASKPEIDLVFIWLIILPWIVMPMPEMRYFWRYVEMICNCVEIEAPDASLAKIWDDKI